MYQLTNGTSILRTSDGASIPNDPNNTDYANYLVWVAAGNTADPVPPIALSIVQSTQNALLTTSCQNAIISGFNSSALGSVYTYPSTIQDQQNQITVSINPNGGSLWCETNGVWGFVVHTSTQAKQVVSDFTSSLNTNQNKLIAFKAKVAAAITPAAVQAIVWA